jgi:hypothetical protein
VLALGGRVHRLAAICLVAVAAMLVWRVANGPSYIIPLTDFGRDLMGADAVRAGLSPYQTVGDLLPHLPQWDLLPQANDHWIAHSPFAIALARSWSAVFGSGSEATFGLVNWFAFGFVATWLGMHATQRFGRSGGVAVAAAFAMAYGLAPDIWYLNGASLAALGLVIVYETERSQRRWISLCLLGVLIAWRPWLAPLALFMPSRRSLPRDLLAVGAVAGAITFASVLWIGGLPVLRDWIFVAMPGNFEHVESWPLNMSILGSLTASRFSTPLFIVLTLAAALLTRRVDRKHWWVMAVITIVVASPLVWPQYWLNLAPLLVLAVPLVSWHGTLLILLLVSSPIAGLNPRLTQVLTFGAVTMGLAAIVNAQRHRTIVTPVAVEPHRIS